MQAPPIFREELVMNVFLRDSYSFADSRRAVVGYW